jgi:replicative DNA helicase
MGMTKMEMPFDKECEQDVLGALLVNPAILPALELIPQDFFLEYHRIIFRVIKDLILSHSPIDPCTVADNLTDSQLRYIGGIPYLTRLLILCPAPSIKAHNAARVIREFRLRREMLLRAQRLANLAMDFNTPVREK